MKTTLLKRLSAYASGLCVLLTFAMPRSRYLRTPSNLCL